MLPLSLPGQRMVFSGSWTTQCESKPCVLGQNHFLSDKTLGFEQLHEIKVDRSRFLNLPARLLGTENGGQGLWAGSSPAVLLAQRGVIMEREPCLPSSPTPTLGTLELGFIPLPGRMTLSKSPFLSLNSPHL